MAQRAWFITGVNSGFGREMTEQLLGRGDRVAGTVRNLDSVRDLTEKYGDRFWPARLDVTDTAEIRKVVDAAFNALGTIDVVVNNAGYGLFGAAGRSSRGRRGRGGGRGICGRRLRWSDSGRVRSWMSCSPGRAPGSGWGCDWCRGREGRARPGWLANSASKSRAWDGGRGGANLRPRSR
jgi:hypothetical protein